MCSSRSKKAFVALLLLQILIAGCLVDAGWTSGEPCQYAGYQPAGTGPEPVSSIPSPTVEAFNDSLGYAFEVAGNGGANGAAMVDLIKKGSKKLTMVAKEFAVFGAFFAATGFNEAPSTNDIIDRVQSAMDELNEEINRRIDDLQEYVEASIIEHDRQLVSNELKTLETSNCQCLGNYITEDDQLECMQRTTDRIWSESPSFEPYQDEFELDLQRENSNQVDVHLTDKQVSHLEAILPLFRTWCSLYLYDANVVAKGYAKKNDPRAEIYWNKIKDYGMTCYNYSLWAYKEMYINKIAQYKDENGDLLPSWTYGGISSKIPDWTIYITSVFTDESTKAYVTATTTANCFAMKDGGRCKCSVSKERGTREAYNLTPSDKAKVKKNEEDAKQESINEVKSRCERMSADYERDFSTYWWKELLGPSKMFWMASDVAAKKLKK